MAQGMKFILRDGCNMLRMDGDYASRMETLVKKNNPGWKPGDAFDTSILDQMDDTLGGLDFKV